MTLPPTTTLVATPKAYLHLTQAQLSTLQLRVYRHTRYAPAPESALQTFVDLINASFAGPYHDENFGLDHPRYKSLQTLRDDLDPEAEGEDGGREEGKSGGWLFMLFLPSSATVDGEAAGGVAVAGAKVTFSGAGMDGGPSVHVLPNPLYTPPAVYPSLVYYLGALGTITPRSGPLLLTHIKRYLSTLSPNYVLKAYTVAEWGVNPHFSIPQDSPLVRFFEKQGFRVQDYAWKAKGTWGSFYGGCLCSIEYVHLGLGEDK
ncbi:hypothetical protein EX895_004489 [Sporisorium graminicola]|uniref:N-acetyltransferase domain-containing protein n=1 Tax=Sporisorium graminicola TaxID=280036 RepID=A0A4U7KPR1_9BASI|nr:hypothetical protein EX895_004489 [Sporisorium graminicola]TKY86340.1 hypothetical protein EX895_004489 [Sporisorium graminicola]